MIQDPAIEAVRRTRKAISAEFGHDPVRLVAHYQKLQERHAHRMLASATDPAEMAMQAPALSMHAKTDR